MPPLPAPSTTGFGFGRIGVTGAGGNLFDGPPTLTFVEVLPCEPLGWKITFGLTTFVTPTEPPTGLCRPVSVPVLGRLPTGVPATGPVGVGLTSIGILGGVPRMQRWNSPPESLAQGSLITTIGGFGSGRGATHALPMRTRPMPQVSGKRQARSINTVPAGQVCGGFTTMIGGLPPSGLTGGGGGVGGGGLLIGCGGGFFFGAQFW